MPQVLLTVPRRVALLGQLVAAVIPQHVGMHQQGNLGQFPCPPDDSGDRIMPQLAPAFVVEHQGAIWVNLLQLLQGLYLVWLQTMLAADPALQTVDTDSFVVEHPRAPRSRAASPACRP